MNTPNATVTTGASITDALQTWITNAPTHLLDLTAAQPHPDDSPAQSTADHALTLADAGHVLRLTDVTMTGDDVLAFTSRVNKTPTNDAHLTPSIDGRYRVDVLGTTLTAALSPEVRRFAEERLDAIDYAGVLHIMEIVSRHIADQGTWYDAEHTILREISQATGDRAAHITHAIECVGPVDAWVADTESFWGVIFDDGAPRDAYYGEPVPADWPTLNDERTGALFYLATVPDHILTRA